MDIEDIANSNEYNKIKSFVLELTSRVQNVKEKKEIDKIVRILNRKFRIAFSKTKVRNIYYKHFNHIDVPYIFKRWLIKKDCRSRSGVLVSTVTLAPSWKIGEKSGKFSCSKNCYYCPQETNLKGEPTQPRSYLSNEPAMLRAIRHNFDIKDQIHDRILTYIGTGNIQPDDKSSKKMEIIVSGGTWESFPEDYRDEVITDIYYAANVFGKENRNKLSLEKEKEINQTAEYRIIGLTLETRPDFINKYHILKYIRYGVTRIQIGVQHYDDVILKKINRGCYTKDTIKAIYMLKNCGFKVVVHLMPDLPGSSPESDKWMFEQAITNPDLQFDDVKIYPTAVCKSSDENLIVKSKIADWYNEGSYKPYAEENLQDLVDVIKYYLTNVKPWVRVQRVIRDIPIKGIEAGYSKAAHLRQIIMNQIKKENKNCLEIRNMEIGDNIKLYNQAKLVVRKYIASKGTEYHITYEAYDFSLQYLYFLIKYYLLIIFGIKTYFSGNNDFKALFGFLRLRVSKDNGLEFVNVLKNSAIIREVHVYGQTIGIGDNEKYSQHRGYGQKLVKTAEEIVKQHNIDKIAIIAGVGTREYYKNKCGYKLKDEYMIKENLLQNNNYFYYLIIFGFIIYFLIIST